ncbi:MAG: hypothetical protein ACTSRA_17875 [Promethearchaeota archaeon]
MKVSKETLKRLHKVVGEITAEKGESVTLEDALVLLLDENEKRKKKESFSKIEEDRRAFLSLLDQKFQDGGPEDYKEYNYEDIRRE